MPRLEDFHTDALCLCPSLFLAPVQVAFGAGHGFVAEDQLDSVGVNAALPATYPGCASNNERAARSWRSAPRREPFAPGTQVHSTRQTAG